LAESCSAVLAHTIQAHIHALYTVIIDPKNPAAFLQLDACGHYVERNCRLLTDAELLDGRRKCNGFYVSAPELEFAYLLAKALAKGTDLAPRLPILRELSRRNPSRTRDKFARLTGDQSPLETWLERPAKDWMQLSDEMLRRHRPRLTDRALELFRRLRRVIGPKGFHIGLTGGTTEARQRLRARVGPVLETAFFRRQIFHDFASGYLNNPVHSPPCCGAACIWDFSIQYFRRLFPAKVRNELIFSEGGVEDLMRNPTRFGMKSIGGLGGLLAPYAPRPDLTVLLADERLLTEVASNQCAEGCCPARCLILSNSQTEDAQVAAVVQQAILLL